MDISKLKILRAKIIKNKDILQEIHPYTDEIIVSINTIIRQNPSKSMFNIWYLNMKEVLDEIQNSIDDINS